MTAEFHGDTPGGAQSVCRMDQESSVSYMDCLFGILTSSKETEGRFGLIEMVAPKGREPSRHLHHTDDEGFYVLDGDVAFYVGEETYKVGPGTSVCVPHGVAHSYTFETDVVRMLCITAPGGLDAHFQDARFSEPGRTLTLPPLAEESEMATVEEMARDLANYGTEVVDPPGPPQKG